VNKGAERQKKYRAKFILDLRRVLSCFFNNLAQIQLMDGLVQKEESRP
jgi:hypothetical protein